MKARYVLSLFLISFTVGWMATVRSEAQQTGLPAEVIHYADTVLYNGKVLTADEKFTIAEAVAIRDGKFLALGPTNRILPMAGPRTRKIDLKGKAAAPGFIDTHQHPFSEAWRGYMESKYKVRTPVYPEAPWSDADTALQAIRRAVEAVKPGEPVLLSVGQFGTLCEGVTLKQLDAVSPNNPLILIMIINNWPEAINSKAAELVKEYVTGPIFRTEETPCLTIGSREIVSGYFWSRIPFDEMMQVSRQATAMAAGKGITLVKEHTALTYLTGIRELWALGELNTRVRMPFPIYPPSGQQSVIPTKEAEKWFMQTGNLSNIGDDMFRLVGIRPSAVGGNMTQGGTWTIEPKLRELPGKPDRPYGGTAGIYDPKIGDYELQEGETFPGQMALIQAVRYGWDVATDHTIGDRSVEEVLKAMEEGKKTQVIKRPSQILAMGHTPMIKRAQLQRMKALGLRPGIGPWHVFTDFMIEAAFTQYGTERINDQMVPLKSFIAAGLKPGLEGDMLTEPTFWKLYAAITRKDDKYKRVWNPQERVSRQEALWMSTVWPAYQLGEDNKLGTVEPGKLADLIVIDKDYMTIPEDDIANINVLLTIVGGKVVHEVPGATQ